jgi:hypothetical protein
MVPLERVVCYANFGSPSALLTPMRPETRFARSGNVLIAYQVVGDGPLDLVYVRERRLYAAQS